MCSAFHIPRARLLIGETGMACNVWWQGGGKSEARAEHAERRGGPGDRSRTRSVRRSRDHLHRAISCGVETLEPRYVLAATIGIPSALLPAPDAISPACWRRPRRWSHPSHPRIGSPSRRCHRCRRRCRTTSPLRPLSIAAHRHLSADRRIRLRDSCNRWGGYRRRRRIG